MGLDQFAFAKAKGKEAVRISYWRKHNRLHGWMESLYHENGEEGELNTEKLPLTLEDLDVLEQDIVDRCLPKTSGFFFGDDSYEEYEKYFLKQDMDFIQKARECINRGEEVYYTSWW